MIGLHLLAIAIGAAIGTKLFYKWEEYVPPGTPRLAECQAALGKAFDGLAAGASGPPPPPPKPTDPRFPLCNEAAGRAKG